MQTKALFVKKKALSEFDEAFIFFTEDFGFIRVLAFGSRSPISKRGKHLSNPGLFLLYLSKKQGYVLEDIELLRPFSFINTLALYRGYLKLMNGLYASLKQAPTLKEDFHFLQSVLVSEFFKPIRGFEYELISMSIQRNLGELPAFYACSICGKICSETYYYDFYKKEFYGLACQKVKEQTLIEVGYEEIIFLNEFHSRFAMNLAFMLKMKESLNAVPANFLHGLKRLGRSSF